MASSSSHSLGMFPALGQPEMDLLASDIPINVSFITLQKKTITSRSFGVECIQPYMEVSGELCLSSYSINSSSVFQVSSRTCHRSFQTSYSVDTMLNEASWLPTVLNMLEDIPHWCPIIKDIITDVSVGWELKGLLLWHFTLWLLRVMCCTEKGYLLQSVRQW